MGTSVVSLDTAVFSHARLKVPPLHSPHGCRLWEAYEVSRSTV